MFVILDVHIDIYMKELYKYMYPPDSISQNEQGGNGDSHGEDTLSRCSRNVDLTAQPGAQLRCPVNSVSVCERASVRECVLCL